MRSKTLSLTFSLLGCLLTQPPLAFAAPDSVAATSQGSWPIVVRNGDQLLENGKPFRFFGLAAPNIQQNESQLRPDWSNRFPDEFELRDTLEGLRRVGSRATRTFSLSVFHPDDKGAPVYITARRTYNEEAFRCLDRLLALCPEYDVRLIIPFIASQSFPTIRGVDEFALLSGKPGPSFWTDPEVKEDFRHFLRYILNRRNTITGRLYKDDPAILAWQLGNEFGSYPYDRKMNPEPWERIIREWSLEMAAFIKAEDPSHLVMEAGGANREAFLTAPHIDVISEHLYEYWNKLAGRPYDLAPIASDVWKQCRGRKPLIIDEFGLGTHENSRRLMKTIREEGMVGGLLWSIRSHRRDGGWFYHNEGGTPVNSFHVPGFAVGHEYGETRVLDLLRQEAFAIRGLPVPPLAPPCPTPVLLPLGKGLIWRGSAGASSYVLERADAKEGPWTTVARDLADSVIADVKSFEKTFESEDRSEAALYHDETATAGATHWYRIKGVNLGGETAWSEPVQIQSNRE